MSVKFQNNAFGTLSGSITNIATAISLSAGQGARFPVLAAGDYFYATLIDAAANFEIIKVTARVTDTLTAVRAQDGTAGRAYVAGDRLELRPCNVSLLALAQEAGDCFAASGTGTYTATLDPVPTGYNTNQIYYINFASANAAASPTLNLNSLGAKTVKHLGGDTIQAGDIPAGLYAILLYNGTDFLLLNPWIRAGVFPATGTDTYAATLLPVPVAYRSDQLYQITFANANATTAPTLNINAMGPKTIKAADGTAALVAGAIAAGMTGVLQYDGTNFRLLNPALVQYTSAIALSLCPAGAILSHGGTTAPAGWLPCDGAAVLRATYPALFTAIGITWGAGDGTTTFNVPNLARRTTVGSGGTGTGVLGNVVGNVGGAETITLTVAQIPAHQHQETIAGNPGGPYGVSGVAATGSATTDQYTLPTGGGAAHDNLPPSAVVLKIIKT